MAPTTIKSTQSKKRIFVCCDGTWNDSISTDSPLTNVSRFARCVKEVAKDGTMQIVYYHTGIGTGTSKFASAIDGATGRGIHANVRDAYSFICNNFNFDHGEDEIFLVGFSRGAFTVRCVAALIDCIGLLKKRGLIHLHELYRLWTQRSIVQGIRWEWPGMSYEKTYRSSSELLIQRLEQLRNSCYLERVAKIRACAVWDTVSALGSPLLKSSKASKLPRVDTHVPETVELALHALALNEHRKHFSPDLWTSHNPQETLLKQCWFLGAHSDIGGGNEDSGLASMTLIWMISQLSSATGAEFDSATVMELVNPLEWHWPNDHDQYTETRSVMAIVSQTDPVDKSVLLPTTAAITGEVSNSSKGIFALTKKCLRRPGRSQSAEPRLSLSSVGVSFGLGSFPISLSRTRESPLESSTTGDSGASETIHFSVRVMMASYGIRCPVLEAYKTTSENGRVIWRSQSASMEPKLGQKQKFSRVHGERDDVGTIREDDVSSTEFSMLQDWLKEDGTLVESPPSLTQPTEALVKLDLPGRTQLARRLLPLLGEAQRPTIHYPMSLETQPPNLARVAEGKIDLDSGSEDELHPGYCLTQDQSIYRSFVYPVLHRYNTVSYGHR